MKKILFVCTLGLVLFMTACSSRMTGESTTVCTDAPTTTITDDDIVTTVVTLTGEDERLLTWTENITVGRQDYENYYFGMEISDEEIQEMFDNMALFEHPGFIYRLISINSNEVVFELIYDYSELTNREANELWGTDDFAREVTLTSAIRGLENQGASCVVNP